jgi:DNA-binding LacI/PurR family transcriptional regulator
VAVVRDASQTRARVTLAEVAARCGVSRMTVSNAYNRPDQLSPELRARVLATAEQLGYGGPSAAGRALKRGRAGVLGVLLTEALPYAFGDPGTVSFLHGVTAATAEAGLALQLIPAAAATAERLVRDAAVDGLIAHSPADDDPALAAALRRRLPTVVNGGPHLAGLDCVTVDNAAAAAAAAAHLTGLGHRRLGVVTWRLHADGHTGWVSPARLAGARFEVFRRRLQGYLRAAAAAGLPPESVRVWEQPGHSVADGRAAGHALLGLPGHIRPTAVLASTDVLALGVARAARDRGLRVPGDLSVTGFDDIGEAGRALPPLTTVHQSLYEQGQDCARALIAPGQPITLLHPARLIVRASTAPPPAAAPRADAASPPAAVPPPEPA